MTITLEHLTKGNLEGQGVFDTLMRSMSSHLDSQYRDAKITGSDYATVYLGAVTAVLNMAVQFLLGSEQLNKQLLLVESQIENVKKNTALIEAQIRNMDADTLVKGQQKLLVEEQTAQMVEQTKLTTQQINKLLKDIELQTEVILKTVQETALTKQNVINTTNQNTTITKQQEKLDNENAILVERLKAEKAQTQGTETTVSGMLGKQMLLLQKQADGFDRNAEQKLAKMLIDTWTVRQTTDGADTAGNGLNDNEINKVLNKAKAGIGVAVFNG